MPPKRRKRNSTTAQASEPADVQEEHQSKKLHLDETDQTTENESNKAKAEALNDDLDEISIKTESPHKDENTENNSTVEKSKSQPQPPPLPPQKVNNTTVIPPDPKSKSQLVQLSDEALEVTISIRILVSVSLGEILEDQNSPISKLLLDIDSSGSDPTRIAEISLEKLRPGVTERVATLTGKASAVSHAISIISFYASLRKVLKNPEQAFKLLSKLLLLPDNEVIQPQAKLPPLPSTRKGRSRGRKSSATAPDAQTKQQLSELAAIKKQLEALKAILIEATLLIPEYTIIKKNYENPSRTLIDNTQQKTQNGVNLSSYKEGKEDNLVPIESNINTDGRFSLSRQSASQNFLFKLQNETNTIIDLPAYSLPMSSDRALYIRGTHFESVRNCILKFICHTFILDSLNRKENSESDDEESEDEFISNVDFEPVPITGVYGHPAIFRTQQLNIPLLSSNPYHNPALLPTVNKERLAFDSIKPTEAAGDNEDTTMAVDEDTVIPDAPSDQSYTTAVTAPVSQSSNQPATAITEKGTNKMYSGPAVAPDGTVHLMVEGGMRQAQLQAQAGIPGQQLTQSVFIPNFIVGAVIGKQGSKINEIRQASGSMIRINDENSVITTELTPGDGNIDMAAERKVTIIGTPESNQLALVLLHQRVESEIHNHTRT